MERRVGLRQARQVILTRPNPPKIWAVVDEAVLRRHIGGPEVMRAQFRHLIELTQRPNVTIQIMRFRRAATPRPAGRSASSLRRVRPRLTSSTSSSSPARSTWTSRRHRQLPDGDGAAVHRGQPRRPASVEKRLKAWLTGRADGRDLGAFTPGPPPAAWLGAQRAPRHHWLARLRRRIRPRATPARAPDSIKSRPSKKRPPGWVADGHLFDHRRLRPRWSRRSASPRCDVTRPG